MKKTANYDVRHASVDRKKCATVTETDDYVVNNVSGLYLKLPINLIFIF